MSFDPKAPEYIPPIEPRGFFSTENNEQVRIEYRPCLDSRNKPDKFIYSVRNSSSSNSIVSNNDNQLSSNEESLIPDQYDRIKNSRSIKGH